MIYQIHKENTSVKLFMNCEMQGGLANLSIIREQQRACAKRAGNNNNIKKFIFPAIRQCEVNSLLVLLVIAFFAVTDFFRSNVELTFSFLLVLRLSLHAVYYAKNETSEQSLYMFLDARPFGSLQAFKLCFCLEEPQNQKKGQSSNAYVEEFIFSSERPKINPL